MPSSSSLSAPPSSRHLMISFPIVFATNDEEIGSEAFCDTACDVCHSQFVTNHLCSTEFQTKQPWGLEVQLCFDVFIGNCEERLPEHVDTSSSVAVGTESYQISTAAVTVRRDVYASSCRTFLARIGSRASSGTRYADNEEVSMLVATLMISLNKGHRVSRSC
jgi:hypothetical protein